MRYIEDRTQVLAAMSHDLKTPLTRLRMRDNGPGIAEEMLERVFDPFFRLEASRSRDTGGTGLGLSIARNSARAAGGELSLHNLPPGGVEARLLVPR
jgi:signal transduction histidine kinase